jgi:hypothetical protein
MPSRLICVQVMFLKTSRFLTGMSFRSCRRAKALSSRQIQSIYLLQRKCPRAGLGVRRRKSERLHKRRRFSKKPKERRCKKSEDGVEMDEKLWEEEEEEEEEPEEEDDDDDDNYDEEERLPTRPATTRPSRTAATPAAMSKYT